MKISQTILAIITISLSFNASADIADATRHEKAVVLYEFKETTGDIIDTANIKYGPALNLRPHYDGLIRSPGLLKIPAQNVVTSISPADKITNLCKANKAMTLEVWLSDAEKVEKRSGMDLQKLDQPLRILSLSKGLLNRNFLLGQFYDAGDFFSVAVNTSGNENNAEPGGSLSEPLKSKTSATIIGSPTIQKIIFTLNSDGLGKLYLTDRNGKLYLAEIGSAGFPGAATTYFNNWRTGAYLTLGNEFMTKADANMFFSRPNNFSECTTDDCKSNPNRFWKGNLHLVAVYCQALTKEEVFGGQSLQEMTNKAFDIDPNIKITPTLKKAQEIHQRITSNKTPITNPVLADMEKLIIAGSPVEAAALATSDPSFYNITVKDFAAKMSNREETINTPLNDFTATVVGAVRDELSAQKLLYENMVYIADPNKVAVPSDWADDMLKSNNHYAALGAGRFDLNKVLIKSTQKLFNGTDVVANPTPSGLLTTRQWLAAHAIAGTNRRLVEFSLRQFLCTPLEKAADSTGPDDVVARDIDRYPGGLHSKYTSTCRACHTIMDGFRPAFAQFTFSNNFVKHSLLVPELGANEDEEKSAGMKQNPRYIASKLNHNETAFPEGRITTGVEWVNNANRGINANHFGWTRNSGKGINDFGHAMAESKAFPRCMAQRVFRSVCKREVAATDQAMITEVATEFEKNRNYNLKYLFQKIVTTPECLGEQK